ncbi:MAG: 30S ribosomal protein S20 [Anaerolineae bacterium]
MANTKSAQKRVRQNEKRRVRNRVIRTRTRTFVKKAKLLVAAGQVDEAQGAVQVAVSQLDKAAQKGIIHRKAAARRKSRLMKHLNALQSTEA